MNRFIICDQSALGRGGHYLEYSLCVAKAAQRKGFHVHILCNRRLDVSIIPLEGIDIHPVFSNTWGETESDGLPSYGPGHIVYETEMALLHVGAGSGDHVLLHTLGLVELRAWIAFLIDIPLYRLRELPILHFLMRFDPEPLENDISIQWAGLRRQLQKRQSVLQAHVHWCSDTDRLANRYAQQLGMSVSIAPIPFDQAPLIAALNNRKQLRQHGVVTVIYLGDARPEKGFDCFGRLVTELWESHLKPRRLRFVFQANTNVPGGEGNILQVIRSLGQYPPSMVELINEPMTPQAYFECLVASDIVLIPYSVSRYHSRSSGVLIEALAAGKPVITTAGSWMATQVSETHAVLIEDNSKLASALAGLLLRLPAAKRAAQQMAGRWQEFASPDNYIAHLLANVPAGRNGKATATVLYVMDGDAIVLRNGASRVAMRQLQYLFSCNFCVIGVFVATHYSRTPQECAEWSCQLGKEIRDLPFAAVHVLAVNPAANDGVPYRYLQQQKQMNAYSILRDMRLAEALSIPARLLAQIRQQTPDLVLLNYVVYQPLLDALGLAHLPVVCEMHDVQSFQKAIYAKRMVVEEDMRQEFALLAKCQYLISLNDVETALIKDYLPTLPCVTVHMAFDLMETGPAVLGGYSDLAELVAACGSDDPAFGAASMLAGYITEEQQRLINFGGHLDLLYVSSAHQSNVSGLKWFIENVFLPVLLAKGVTMVVAGTIKYACEWHSCPNLVFVGKLDDLTPLYAAGRLCVLPIIEGAGSPIKTFEALAYGKPVIGTGLAFRGLPEVLMKQVIQTDDSNAMAKAIMQMLNKPKERKKYRQALKQALSVLASREQYHAAMSKAISVATSGKLKSGKFLPSKASTDNDECIEWDENIQLANAMFGAWLWRRDLADGCLGRAAKYALPTLKKLLIRFLPPVLASRRAIGMPLSVREKLLAAPEKTVAMLLSIAGMVPMAIERSPYLLKTPVIVHGDLHNILIIQLLHSDQSVLELPTVRVWVDQQLLQFSSKRGQGNNVALYYDLPVDNTFLNLQQIFLEVEFASNDGWEIERVLLKEIMSIEKMCDYAFFRDEFHDIEKAPDGRTFAWTAAQAIHFYLPCWRGMSKMLMLDAYSLRKNQQSDIFLSLNNNKFEFDVSVRNESGIMGGTLLNDPISPFPGSAVMKTTYFEQASPNDSRLIGIAMHGIFLVSEIA